MRCEKRIEPHRGRRQGGKGRCRHFRVFLLVHGGGGGGGGGSGGGSGGKDLTAACMQERGRRKECVYSFLCRPCLRERRRTQEKTKI